MMKRIVGLVWATYLAVLLALMAWPNFAKAYCTEPTNSPSWLPWPGICPTLVTNTPMISPTNYVLWLGATPAQPTWVGPLWSSATNITSGSYICITNIPWKTNIVTFTAGGTMWNPPLSNLFLLMTNPGVYTSTCWATNCASSDTNICTVSSNYFIGTCTWNVIKITLASVAFTSNHMIYNDADGMPYPLTQWTTSSNWPVCYTRNTPMTVQPQFVVMPSSFTGPVLVEGISSGPQLPVTNTLTPTLTSTNNFTNCVNYFNPLTIKWQVSLDGTNWNNVGTNSNKVYVTLNDPTCATLFHTVVDVACRNAVGQTVESSVVTGIWSGFVSRSVLKWDGTGPMQYWGTNAAAHANATDGSQLDSTAKLVQYADGQCGAWASFLGDVFSAHNIGSKQIGITLTNTYPPTCINPAGFEVYTNLPGQGRIPLVSDFYNHQIVKYGGTYYDPSYGAFYSSQQAWEDASLNKLIYGTNSPYNVMPDPKGSPVDTQFNFL